MEKTAKVTPINGKRKKNNVCEEAPADLIVNNKRAVTFMCTPDNLGELAMGYLLSRGIIREVDDILSLAACDDRRKVVVKIRQELTGEHFGLSNILTTGCGSGVVLPEYFSRSQVKSSLAFSLQHIKAMAAKMIKQAVLYKETGGVHCAALGGALDLVVIREDVGRHNAVDKVLGKSLYLGLNLSNHLLITTGRISSDMILKAIATGIPMVVSKSIPTTMALQLAGRMGVTIIGRISAINPEIYTCSHRVLLSGECREI